jgi:hypothetical protein
MPATKPTSALGLACPNPRGPVYGCLRATLAGTTTIVIVAGAWHPISFRCRFMTDDAAAGAAKYRPGHEFLMSYISPSAAAHRGAA